MKLYLDDNDIAKTVTFEEENGVRQRLYVHGDKDGFIFKSLAEHDETLIKELCKEISSAIAYEVFVSGKLTHKEVETAIEKVEKNRYGIRS